LVSPAPVLWDLFDNPRDFFRAHLPFLDFVGKIPAKLPSQSPEFHLGVVKPLDLSEAYVVKKNRTHFERYCLHYDLAVRSGSSRTHDKLHASPKVDDGTRHNIWRQYFTVVQNRDSVCRVKITELLNN
jgi:hypothetical protein